MSDTIFALASAPGRAGVAVVRVSGPRAGQAAFALAGGMPQPRKATLLRLSWKDGIIDRALVLWFPAPASFTGEDVAEFQIHGGGETQREMAYRFGVNLVMYALTGNYKADTVHAPALLKRLGR